MMNNQEPLEFESANSENSYGDIFPQHEELDSFIELLRNHVYRGLCARGAETIDSHELNLIIAELSEEYVHKFRTNPINPASIENNLPLSACIKNTSSDKGAMQLAEHFASQPFPRFEQNPDDPEMLIRVDEDGTRTVGQFQGREFVPQQ